MATKNQWMMDGARYVGIHEMPVIKPCNKVPTGNLARFSDVVPNQKASRNQWVCFYEGDDRFEKIWDKASVYVPMLKKFDGIITPDFSMYVDMPLELQRWNCWRSRVIGNYLQREGGDVVPNVRYGDARTYDFCFDGLPKDSVLSVGTLGCVKDRFSRRIFEDGLRELIRRLVPSCLIVYGPLTPTIKNILDGTGTNCVHFDCKTRIAHKGCK